MFQLFDWVCQDHFRRFVNPAFTSVYSEREKVFGVVEFDSSDDLKYAIRKLDNTEFKNPFDRAYIRILDDSRDQSHSRSRSRSRYAIHNNALLIEWHMFLVAVPLSRCQ